MGLELDDFKVPSKSKLFCDSMILIYYSDVLKKHYHVENSVSKKKKKNQCANPNFILLCVVKKNWKIKCNYKQISTQVYMFLACL